MTKVSNVARQDSKKIELAEVLSGVASQNTRISNVKMMESEKIKGHNYSVKVLKATTNKLKSPTKLNAAATIRDKPNRLNL